MPKALFEINPDIDRAAYARCFAEERRVQVRDILTRETAEEIRAILAGGTKWGIAWQSGDASKPQAAEWFDLAKPEGQQTVREAFESTHRKAADGDYSFRFARYPILNAYLEKWAPDGPHDLLMEYINAPEMIDLVREITGVPELIKADAQATLYGSGHFLGVHSDSHVEEGWKVAYVMNFTIDDWKPDWGGYLNFLDEEGDIITGFRPRFNALNLFRVPQAHSVSYIPPFAPQGRYAITGWFRDR